MSSLMLAALVGLSLAMAGCHQLARYEPSSSPADGAAERDLRAAARDWSWAADSTTLDRGAADARLNPIDGGDLCLTAPQIWLCLETQPGWCLAACGDYSVVCSGDECWCTTTLRPGSRNCSSISSGGAGSCAAADSCFSAVGSRCCTGL